MLEKLTVVIKMSIIVLDIVEGDIFFLPADQVVVSHFYTRSEQTTSLHLIAGIKLSPAM